MANTKFEGSTIVSAIGAARVAARFAVVVCMASQAHAQDQREPESATNDRPKDLREIPLVRHDVRELNLGVPEGWKRLHAQRSTEPVVAVFVPKATKVPKSGYPMLQTTAQGAL